MQNKRMKIRYVTLGLALLGGIFSVLVDYDHIWEWVFHTAAPYIFKGSITSNGRPFHTDYIFGLYGLVLSIRLTALMVRHLQSGIMVEDLK